jgi:hypothetical protein
MALQTRGAGRAAGVGGRGGGPAIGNCVRLSIAGVGCTPPKASSAPGSATALATCAIIWSVVHLRRSKIDYLGGVIDYLGRVIGAPWLVHGGHGASLRQPHDMTGPAVRSSTLRSAARSASLRGCGGGCDAPPHHRQ